MSLIDTRVQKRIKSCTAIPTDKPAGNARAVSCPAIRTGEDNSKPKFVQITCGKKQFPILNSSIETINGILTICSQDFRHAPALLSEKYLKLLSSDSISIFTKQDLSKYTKDGASGDEQLISAEELVEKINNAEEFSLIIADDQFENTIYEFLKTKCDRIPIGVLIVKSINTCTLRQLPNVFKSVLTSEKGGKTSRKDADILLSRCAHGILSAIYSKLKEQTFSGSKESVLDVCDLVKSSFQRHKIPDNEWPNIPEEHFQYPHNIDMAIHTCLREKEVMGCLKKRGSLHIYIDSSLEVSDTENKIRDQMVQHDIIECEAVFKYGKIIRFCSSGDLACCDMECSGTLGGFVKIATTGTSETKPKTQCLIDPADAITVSNSGTEQAAVGSHETPKANSKLVEPLVALIARHVATTNLNKYLCVGPNERKLGPIKGMQFSETLDMYPVMVDNDKISLCDTRFRTEYGDQLYAHRNIVDTIRGAIVHLWGRRISPGLGIIEEKNIQGNNGSVLIIRNRYMNNEFATPGDSGAMVCYYDANNELLYAIATLIGPYIDKDETTPTRYSAQVLDDGLCVLSRLNHCKLELCDKNSE